MLIPIVDSKGGKPSDQQRNSVQVYQGRGNGIVGIVYVVLNSSLKRIKINISTKMD